MMSNPEVRGATPTGGASLTTAGYRRQRYEGRTVMNRTEHLLSCLAEECAEVAQRVSKALRFGLTEVQPGQPLTNAQRIGQEFHDLLAVVEMLEDEGALDRPTDTHAIERKKAKVLAFLEYAEQCGALTPNV